MKNLHGSVFVPDMAGRAVGLNFNYGHCGTFATSFSSTALACFFRGENLLVLSLAHLCRSI